MRLSRAQVAALVERIGVAALIAAILTAAAASLPPSNVAQGWLSDAAAAARVSIFGRRPLESPNVLLVGMDSRTLAAPELAGTPQAMFSPVYAELARKGFEHGARGLVIDVILAYDAKDLLIDGETPLKRYDNAFLGLLKQERERGRIVLGRSAGVLPARRFTLIAGEKGLGMVEVPLGPGGVVREVPTVLPDRAGELYQTLSGRALTLLGLEAPPLVNVTPRDAISTLPSVSMIDILRCNDSEALERVLKGRIMFLGGMLPGQDRLKAPDVMIKRPPVADRPIDPGDVSVACEFPQPMIRGDDEETVPGVYIHAAAVDAVASGWQVSPVGRPAVLGMVFLSGLLGAFLSFVFRPALGTMAMAMVTVLVFLVAVRALEKGFYLPVAWAIAASPAGFLAGYGVRIRLLDRKSNMIRREFGRYLSPVLVQQMVDTGQLPHLEGEVRDVTVLFADLIGFTAASERVESAELMRILNRYLDVMAGVIADRGGYVDKFIGDAVMAMFNAPAPMRSHAAEAVAAAHEIERKVRAMAEADHAGGTLAFGVKIGIASGAATVGNVGARDRVNYTVVGEIVNLASRLESLPGVFGTPIVIDPATAAEVGDQYRLLRIVTIQVKGKSAGVTVFAPFTVPPDAAGDDALSGLIRRHDGALAEFEAGRFEAAGEAWAALAGADWPGARIAAELARVAARLAANPPADWKGILEATAR